jgi:hypothetical protein
LSRWRSSRPDAAGSTGDRGVLAVTGTSVGPDVTDAGRGPVDRDRDSVRAQRGREPGLDHRDRGCRRRDAHGPRARRDGCVGTFAAELFFFIERRQPGTIEVSGVAEVGDPAVADVPVVLFPA